MKLKNENRNRDKKTTTDTDKRVQKSRYKKSTLTVLKNLLRLKERRHVLDAKNESLRK